jgi:glycosyltransferase involved in cell wall biosynthesis
MPSVLQINPSVNTGSTGRIVEQLGQFIAKQGWGSIVAYGRNCFSESLRSVKIGSRASVNLHVLWSRISDRHGLGSLRATRTFIQDIRRLNPDIIHLHNIHGYYLNYPVLFKFLAESNIQIVWTLHDCWPLTGHCTYFSDINCIKWKTECHHCPKTKNYPASIFLDRSNENYFLKKRHFTSLKKLTIIPVSNWLGGIVRDSYLSKYPMRIINNGIDLNSFYPGSDSYDLRSKYRINDKFMMLGVASTWDQRKGWDDYMALSKILSDEYAIVMVGLSRKQMKSLPANIIGIERTENLKELASLYSVANIVLNLSYQETFGMTTVEGLACGTPVIVYNCTASPDLISRETGLAVEPGSIRQLTEAIGVIKKNGKTYYSESCRKRAETFFNKDEKYKEYLELYEQLLIL